MKYLHALTDEEEEITMESADGYRNLVKLAQYPDDEVQREAVWTLAILASNSGASSSPPPHPFSYGLILISLPL